MKRSYLYKIYIKMMEVVSEWNVNTRCYVLGRIESEYEASLLQENEMRDLLKKINISDEDIKKINIDKKITPLSPLREGKNYENISKLIETVSCWNINTCCYLLGRIGADYCGNRLSEEEYVELFKKVPLSIEEKYNINF